MVVEMSWISSLLRELQLPLSRPPIVCYDNLSIVLLSANPIQHVRTKHVELDLYLVRERVAKEVLL